MHASAKPVHPSTNAALQCLTSFPHLTQAANWICIRSSSDVVLALRPVHANRTGQIRRAEVGSCVAFPGTTWARRTADRARQAASGGVDHPNPRPGVDFFVQFVENCFQLLLGLLDTSPQTIRLLVSKSASRSPQSVVENAGSKR